MGRADKVFYYVYFGGRDEKLINPPTINFPLPPKCIILNYKKNPQNTTYRVDEEPQDAVSSIYLRGVKHSWFLPSLCVQSSLLLSQRKKSTKQRKIFSD